MAAAVALEWAPAAGLRSGAADPSPRTSARLADGKGAQVFNRALAVATEDGRAVARLDARAGDGGVLFDGVLLGEGVIEVDLKGKDVAQQSFLGIAFHVVDWTTLDAVYFRPFNFRAGTAEQRAHAVQYVSHPSNTWQRLRAERPGQFEQAIEPPPDPSGWFHARIVLAGGRVEVFVNGSAKPSLVVEDLGAREERRGGLVGWQRVGRRVREPPHHAHGAGRSAAGKHAEHLPGLVDRQSRAGSGAGGGRCAGGRRAESEPVHAAPCGGALRPARDSRVPAGEGRQSECGGEALGHSADVAYEAGQMEFVAWLEQRGARFTPLTFDVAEVAPSIRRVSFPWGMMNNIVVFSGADGAVVIDTGFSTRAIPELKRLIAGWSASGVKYVVNTHAHGDHVAGNAIAPSPQADDHGRVARRPGIRASRSRGRPSRWRGGRGGRCRPRTRSAPAASDIQLIPRPGLHSDADLIVYFPAARVVDLGDLLLSESVPAAQDIAGYLAFLDDVLDVFPEDATFISGHGRDLDSAGVRAYRDTLKAMVEVIRTNAAAAARRSKW